MFQLFMANQPTPLMYPPQKWKHERGLMKGNQWQINPDHKALFLGGLMVGWLAMTYLSLLGCRPCICHQPLHLKLFNNWVFPRQQHWQRCVSLEGSSHRVTTKKTKTTGYRMESWYWMAPKKIPEKNQQTNIPKKTGQECISKNFTKKQTTHASCS